MRVFCNLRALRDQLPRKADGTKISLRDIEEKAGVSAGVLSMIERGVMLPADRQVAALEAAYGATIDTWYQPRLLVALEHDPQDEH